VLPNSRYEKKNENKRGPMSNHMIELIVFFDTIFEFMTLQNLRHGCHIFKI